MKKIFILIGQAIVNFTVIAVLFWSLDNVFNLTLESNLVIVVVGAYLLGTVINQVALTLLTLYSDY